MLAQRWALFVPLQPFHPSFDMERTPDLFWHRPHTFSWNIVSRSPSNVTFRDFYTKINTTSSNLQPAKMRKMKTAYCSRSARHLSAIQESFFPLHLGSSLKGNLLPSLPLALLPFLLTHTYPAKIFPTDKERQGTYCELKLDSSIR